MTLSAPVTQCGESLLLQIYLTQTINGYTKDLRRYKDTDVKKRTAQELSLDEDFDTVASPWASRVEYCHCTLTALTEAT